MKKCSLLGCHAALVTPAVCTLVLAAVHVSGVRVSQSRTAQSSPPLRRRVPQECGDKGEGGEENPHRTIGEMYVGKYFTAEGEFDEARWRQDVLTHIQRFEAGKYGVFKYDHKSD